MKLQNTASFLVLLAAPASVSSSSSTSSLIHCLLNADPSAYSSCCTAADDSSSPICKYLACEMGELPPDQCSCSTLTSFCGEVQQADNVVVPPICEPSLECCSVDENTGESSASNEEFQSCMAEAAGEMEPTSFLELNSHLVEEKKVAEKPAVVGAVMEENASYRVGGVSMVAVAAFGAAFHLL
ncbi:hypothetical protein ACHAXN_002809 [Cyclotella atomus]|jgi:hypothetical protein